MASPTTAFSAPSQLPMHGRMQARIARHVPVHGLARFAFWTIMLLSMTNAIGFFITLMKRLHDADYELSVYPVVFAICTVIVLAFTKGRQRSALLVAAWVFWLLYFLGGFLGSMQITSTDIRAALRVTVKPWMGIVGLPLLALRAISADKVPRLIHVTVIVACLVTIIGLLQVAVSGFMEGLIADVGRAEGLWAMPTTSGFIGAMAFFLTLLCPFKSRVLNWISRVLLLAGVCASLSRGPIIALLISLIVYAITGRRFATLAKTLLGVVLFVAASVAVLGALETVSEHHEQRVSTVRSMLAGDWTSDTFTGRTQLWGPAIDAILFKGGLLFGLGHGSMSDVVGQTGYGISPHNYYIYVLGNSGLFALIGLLAFHFVLFHQAFRFPEREKRAAVFAIGTFWMLAHMVDNALIGDPAASAVFACVVAAIAYANPRQRRLARPSFNGAVRQIPR